LKQGDAGENLALPLERLQAQERRHVPWPPMHSVITNGPVTDEELETWREWLVEKGEIKKDDGVIFNVPIDPPPRPD
jgi:hypothetical protein